MQKIRLDGKNKIPILAINHHFDQDLKALEQVSLYNISLIKIEPNKYFSSIIILFSEDFKKGKYKYDDPLFEESRKISNWRSKIIYKFLKKNFHYKAIITPADTYFWLREFISIAKADGIVTFVIDKEGTIAPYYFDYGSNYLKEYFPFISDQLIVWSESQKHYWQASGISEDRIKVIGQPRCDLLFRQKKEPIEGIQNNNSIILFFTYDLKAYIPVPNTELDICEDDWFELRSETHEIIKELARENRNINFIVKCHPQQRDFLDIVSEFIDYKNVWVLNGAKISNNLLLNSDLVIGFQTTALIESVLLKKPTIYTFWTDIVLKYQSGILPFHEYDSFLIVKSKTELKHTINQMIKSNFNHNIIEIDRKKLLNKYLNNPDGHVSEKIIHFIVEKIQTT